MISFSILAKIGRYGTFILPAGLLVGLLFPSLTYLARPLAEPLVVILLTFSIYRLDPQAIAVQLRHPLIIIAGIAWTLLLVPLLVFTAGTMSRLPPGLLAILVAWSSCPPLVSIPGIALLLGLDGALALLIMVGSMMVFTVSLPLILSALFAQSLPVEMTTLLLRLSVLVLFCLIAGQALRRLVGRHRAVRHAGAVDGTLVLLLAVFAVTIMSGFHRAMDSTPELVPLFLVTTLAASAGLQLLTAFLFRFLKPQIGGALALCAGNRNMSVLLPAMGASLGDDLLLFLAVIQFPIYLLPMLAKPFYKWYGAR